MNNSQDCDRKYIEERVRIIRKLAEQYGDEVLTLAAEAKAELEIERVLTAYREQIPVTMEQYYRIAFQEFEAINDMLTLKLIHLSEDELIVEVSNCKYCQLYSACNARDIGKSMICNMDAPITKALNGDFNLSRPSRMMDGDERCVFIVQRGLLKRQNSEEPAKGIV